MTSKKLPAFERENFEKYILQTRPLDSLTRHIDLSCGADGVMEHCYFWLPIQKEWDAWRARSRTGMKLKLLKDKDYFTIDPVQLPGSPPVGKGQSMRAALGDFVHQYQKELGIEIEVDHSAWRSEIGRRRREVARR